MGLLCLIFALSQANQKVPVMYFSASTDRRNHLFFGVLVNINMSVKLCPCLS